MMAAALFRRGPGLCVRCIHRELCRLVWRSQAALFSSKASDRKQPRRTHIKKAKPQPALDVAKLLEQLFSQQRPGTVSSVVKARDAKASSMPVSNVSAALAEILKVPAVNGHIEPKVNALADKPKTTDPGVMAREKQLAENTTESSTETSNLTVESQEVRTGVIKGPVEPTMDTKNDLAAKIQIIDSVAADISKRETENFLLQTSVHSTVDQPAQTIQINSTDSGLVSEDPLTETTMASSVETTIVPLETLESRAALSEESSEIDTVAVAATQEVQTCIAKSGFVNLSQSPDVGPLVETMVTSVDTHLETQGNRAALADFPLEPTLDALLDPSAHALPPFITDSGPANPPRWVEEETLKERMIEPSVEASNSPQETMECISGVAGDSVETIKDSQKEASISAKEEPLLEIAIEFTQEGSAAVYEDMVQAADNLSETNQTQTFQGSEALTLENIEEPPKMTLDSYTLHEVQVQVESLKAEELLETYAFLDVKVEQELQDLLVQTGTGVESITNMGTESFSIDKSENLSEALSNWESLSDDLQELEGESSMLVKELLCDGAAVVPKVSYSSAGINGEARISPLEGGAAVCVDTVDTALIQNSQGSKAQPLDTIEESTLSTGNDSGKEEVERSPKMTLDSLTLHEVQVQVESLKSEELVETNAFLDGKAEQELQELLVQTGTGVESITAIETTPSSVDKSENLSEVLSNWDSLLEDLQELEGESGMLVKELLCDGPAVVSKVPTSSTGLNRDPEEKGTETEPMTLELVTLANVEAEVRGLETEDLQEIRNQIEKEAEVLAKGEKMEQTSIEEEGEEDVFTSEAELLSLESISEATDAIEAETSVMLEAMFGSEQGPRQPDSPLVVDQTTVHQGEPTGQNLEKEPLEQEGNVLEAMTLESVTLAEVEASLGTLESNIFYETTEYLEKEAEVLAGEKKVQVEDEVPPSKESTEDLNIKSLSLSEEEVLKVDELMEELLFTLPGPVKAVTKDQTHQEDVGANKLDEIVTSSANMDPAAEERVDSPASAAQGEVLQEDEMKEEGQKTEALGNENAAGTHANLDPVQRLFLEKIREYSYMQSINAGQLEAEQEYKTKLSEETLKLQRLYGGGDMSSFPEFTFTEPRLDQES